MPPDYVAGDLTGAELSETLDVLERLETNLATHISDAESSSPACASDA
ncbi:MULTISPECIES: hypothetical protein [unclassified Streptomyces]|uniref:MarR family transcriptional regulator n=1 Tax=Streptomyces sp. NBC_00119 TaxID=2975659 RepID=A0AAU1ULC2_9ACTN|nr:MULTISPECIES: hypothetical protein [unclassified Streptomyces]MCX4649627.1 hypothetical protein [Streptomyces sp. NBC_01446]MCX5321167.1 hypothetical protein [Streptomyces sp. NBC_00120]